MAAGESKTAVIAAIVGNLAIAVSKFVAAALTGSSAMISEGIHSLVDTGNGWLMMLGINRSMRPADERHQYGHGKELYFWSLIVAISIFGIGGGMSIYEGILHILEPKPAENLTISYIVLAVAMVFESASFAVAYRSFRHQAGRRSLWSAIEHGKDPSIFTILFEDSAALIGLIVAFLGVLLTDLTGIPYFDGAASVVIGLLLAGVAVYLAFRSQGLLIGETASEGVIRDVHRVADEEPSIVRIGRMMTMQMGPDDVMLDAEIEFDPQLSTAEVRDTIRRVEARLAQLRPEVKHVFIEMTGSESAADAARPEAGSELPGDRS